MGQRQYTSPYFDLEEYKSLSGEAAFKARTAGMLPILNIKGHPFFIHLRQMKLTPMDMFMSDGIDLNKGGYFHGKKKEYSFFYDPKEFAEAQRDPKTGEFPRGTVLITFPDPYSLDPVAMAQINNKDPRTYLKGHPLAMFREATVTPLAKVDRRIRTVLENKRGLSNNIIFKRK